MVHAMTLETGLLLAIGAMQGAMGVAFVWGQWTRSRELQDDTLAERISTLKDRVDHAGVKMSDLANDVQGMETRLRHEFVPLDRCDERMRLWRPNVS